MEIMVLMLLVYMEIKRELLHKCENFVNNRLKAVQETISSHQKSLLSETKSSAGDKHETGRAMLQLEIEKAGNQLKEIEKMQKVLKKIDVNNHSENICLGSVVYTNTYNYLISISIGKLVVIDKTYYAVSPKSPVGQQLLGKKKGDNIKINNLEINILCII